MSAKLRAIYMPMRYPEVIGLSKRIGDFWVGYYDDGVEGGTISFNVTVPADDSRRDGYFINMNVHHDGVKTLRDLDQRGFLTRFEAIKASTFYDVLQCLNVAGVPLMSHDYDSLEYTSRAMYELLNEPQEAVS